MSDYEVKMKPTTIEVCFCLTTEPKKHRCTCPATRFLLCVPKRRFHMFPCFLPPIVFAKIPRYTHVPPRAYAPAEPSTEKGVGAHPIAWRALTQPSASMGAFRVTFGCGPVLSHRRKASNHAESSSHQKEHSWSTFAHSASPILTPCYRTCFKSFCLLAAEGGTHSAFPRATYIPPMPIRPA